VHSCAWIVQPLVKREAQLGALPTCNAQDALETVAKEDFHGSR
jgi:hypothetical protein